MIFAIPASRGATAAVVRLLLLGLVSILGILYVPVFRELSAVWAGRSYSSYGFLILLWSGWLAWSSRAAVRAAPRRLEPGGLAIVTVGIGLLALATAEASLALAVLSLPVVLIGLGRFTLGRRAFRPLAFATAFLVLMTPLPAQAVPMVSLPLQRLAAWFTELVLAAARIPASRDGLVIRLDGALMHVSAECSGLRFLLVMIVIGFGAAWAVERRFGTRLFVIALAPAVAIGANLVRVAATVALVHFYGLAAAEGTFHSLLGRAIYLAAMSAFLLAVWRLRRPRVTAPGVGSTEHTARAGFCGP